MEINACNRVFFALAALMALVSRIDAQAPPPSAGRPVRTITLEGRELYPEETILERAGIRPGDTWTEASEARVLERLAAWPFLASVGLPRVLEAPDGGVDLFLPVRELRTTGRITFHGNDSLLSATLKEASGLAKGAPLSEDSVRGAEEAIIDRYQDDGFLLASVDGVATPGPGGRADLDFTVHEGRRVYLSAVRLEGASQVPANEVLSLIETQPRRLFGLITRGYYRPGRIEADLDRLRRVYWSKGYLEVELGFGGIELNEKRNEATLTIQVREGPRYEIRNVRIEGQRLFSRQHLELDGSLPSGGFYTGKLVEDTYRRILRWYQEHADIAPVVRVRHEYPSPLRVDLVYEIREEEHYFTGLVQITGNDRSLDRVFRRDVTLVPGKPLTESEIERTRDRLKANGILESFEIRQRRTDDPHVRDVQIALTEKRQTGGFRAGGGASAGAGEVAYFSIHESNLDIFRLPGGGTAWNQAFRGGGQTLDIEVIPGTRESQYQFRFVEPYLFRSDLALGLGGLTSLYDRRSYDESHLRGAATIQKFFDRDHRLSLSVGYIADAVAINNVDSDAPQDVLDAGGHTFLGYPRVELKYNNVVSSYFSGPRGFTATLRADFADSATGSRVNFARTTLTADWAVGLFDDRSDYQHVLRVSVDGGWVEGRGEALPLFERFYLGGPRSFPGFSYRSVGPREGRTTLGGEGMVHGSIEYSLPMVRPEVRPFAFFGWGDLEPSFSRLSDERFRTAAGGGIHFRLKLGEQHLPATLYWVKALSSETDDREQLFSFPVGINF